MDDNIKRDFTHALQIWLTVSKGLEPPKTVARQNRDGWYKGRAEEIAEKVFRTYEIRLRPELEKYAAWNDRVDQNQRSE
jgi:hypothetical protein